MCRERVCGITAMSTRIIDTHSPRGYTDCTLLLCVRALLELDRARAAMLAARGGKSGNLGPASQPRQGRALGTGAPPRAHSRMLRTMGLALLLLLAIVLVRTSTHATLSSSKVGLVSAGSTAADGSATGSAVLASMDSQQRLRAAKTAVAQHAKGDKRRQANEISAQAAAAQTRAKASAEAAAAAKVAKAAKASKLQTHQQTTTEPSVVQQQADAPLGGDIAVLDQMGRLTDAAWQQYVEPFDVTLLVQGEHAEPETEAEAEEVVLRVQPSWSPGGARRVLHMVLAEFLDGSPVHGALGPEETGRRWRAAEAAGLRQAGEKMPLIAAVVQFGLQPDAKVAARMAKTAGGNSGVSSRFADEDEDEGWSSAAHPNVRGSFAFALPPTAAGKMVTEHPRDTQIFVNLLDNKALDGSHTQTSKRKRNIFRPVGSVVKGLPVFDAIAAAADKRASAGVANRGSDGGVDIAQIVAQLTGGPGPEAAALLARARPPLPLITRGRLVSASLRARTGAPLAVDRALSKLRIKVAGAGQRDVGAPGLLKESHLLNESHLLQELRTPTCAEALSILGCAGLAVSRDCQECVAKPAVARDLKRSGCILKDVCASTVGATTTAAAMVGKTARSVARAGSEPSKPRPALTSREAVLQSPFLGAALPSPRARLFKLNSPVLAKLLKQSSSPTSYSQGSLIFENVCQTLNIANDGERVERGIITFTPTSNPKGGSGTAHTKRCVGCNNPVYTVDWDSMLDYVGNKEHSTADGVLLEDGVLGKPAPGETYDRPQAKNDGKRLGHRCGMMWTTHLVASSVSDWANCAAQRTAESRMRGQTMAPRPVRDVLYYNGTTLSLQWCTCSVSFVFLRATSASSALVRLCRATSLSPTSAVTAPPSLVVLFSD